MLATASTDAVRAEEPGWSALGRKRTSRGARKHSGTWWESLPRLLHAASRSLLTAWWAKEPRG